MAGALRRVMYSHAIDALQTPAGQLYAQGQIGILAVHVKAWIETTDRGEHGAADEEKHAGEPIDLAVCRWLATTEYALQELPRRQQAAARISRGAIVLDNDGGHESSVFARRSEQRSEGILLKAQIGVEHREPRRLAATEGLIVVGAETERMDVAQDVRDAARNGIEARRRLFQIERDDQCAQSGWP